MQNDRIKKLLKQGIDHYNFMRIVFSEENRIWLDKISFSDVEEIVDSIKGNSIGLYTFLPFCYVFLGIDLIHYYNQQLQKEWEGDSLYSRIAKDFEYYPIRLHYDNELDDYLTKFAIIKYTLNQVKVRLIKQGAKQVKYLETINGVKVEHDSGD